MILVEAVVRTDDVDGLLDRLSAIGGRHGTTVQAFDARYVVDRAHLERAVERADRARERGEAVARERAVEILCYAAGRRQIDRALGLGIAADAPAVVLVDGGDETAAAAAVRDLDGLAPADSLGAFDPERVREAFDVSETELAAAGGELPTLVHERVALLDVRK